MPTKTAIRTEEARNALLWFAKNRIIANRILRAELPGCSARPVPDLERTVRRNAGWVQCRDDFFHGLLNYAAKKILSPAAGRFSKPPAKVAMVPRNLAWTTTCTVLFAWIELAPLFGFGHRHTASANLAASPSAALTLQRAKSERTRPQDHKPPVLRRLPEFSLTDHHSRPFGTDQLRGNAWDR